MDTWTAGQEAVEIPTHSKSLVKGKNGAIHNLKGFSLVAFSVLKGLRTVTDESKYYLKNTDIHRKEGILWFTHSHPKILRQRF